jgi:hypothetical protein
VYMAIAAVVMLSGTCLMLYGLVCLHTQAVLDRKSNRETGPSDADLVKGWETTVMPLSDALT